MLGRLIAACGVLGLAGPAFANDSIGELGTGGISGGIAGGSLGAIIQHFSDHPGMLGGVVAGTLVGTLAYALTWWYLVRFCADARERAQVQRFMFLNATTGAAWMLGLMLAAAVVAWRLCFAAERQPLESVARPLSAH